MDGMGMNGVRGATTRAWLLDFLGDVTALKPEKGFRQPGFFFHTFLFVSMGLGTLFALLCCFARGGFAVREGIHSRGGWKWSVRSCPCILSIGCRLRGS